RAAIRRTPAAAVRCARPAVSRGGTHDPSRRSVDYDRQAPQGNRVMTGSLLTLVLIGLVSGLASGVFGIGGGVLIVPGLIYLAGFTQHRATGTSLAVLLPPVGLAATIEYYRHGNVDF